LSGNQSVPDKKRTLPDKKERRREQLPDKDAGSLPDKNNERRGWIEYAKRGTKNPKRYAYRRRWERAESGWVKSKQTRVKSIPPLSEEDYVKRIANEGRNQTTGRKRRDRGNRRTG
jgi:hypothetical protein